MFRILFSRKLLKNFVVISGNRGQDGSISDTKSAKKIIADFENTHPKTTDPIPQTDDNTIQNIRKGYRILSMMQGKESESVEESSEEQSLEGSSKSDENTSSNEHHMDYLNNIEIIKHHLRSQEEHKNKGNFIKSVTESLILLFLPLLSH